MNQDLIAEAREAAALPNDVLVSHEKARELIRVLVDELDARGCLAVQEPPQPMFALLPMMFGPTINNACDIIHDWARKKGWWDKPEWRKTLERLARPEFPLDIQGAAHELLKQPVRNKGELLALIQSEASECLEALRKPGTMDDHVSELTGEAAELADVVIRVMDYCGAYGIDLGSAIQRKHEFNITRPPKHGKAF